ncbi:ankyrin repeat, SAM and basic leucine zipper domain-containing protein 1-like isoform X1 [Pocillopora damicornis]|uniref:ankyrin repeat, SAM and basic leucine zipper domain-containing protein 1-like isoform X1 n=1 Tax=Pocillopora damicornis TaxID=46731 RepID=UPI000F54FBB5|nr:ankyrin repeat, SAM and basic leucine zipper domain-containing protein 1-like isoform X1 [Pocillopora damicornis]
MLAASLALPDMVELLANKGANVNFQKEMYTVLMAVCAVPGNKPEDQVLTCVELLVERNARVNVYDKFRMSPLMYAAREGRVTVCEVLLDHDAEINKQDMRGWTSLSWAANRGHGRVVRILLEHGADPKIYSNDGQVPSDLAYSSEHHRVADMLSLAASGKQLPSEVAPQPVASSKVHVSEDSSSSMRYNDLEMFLCGLELTHLLPVFQMGITQVGVRTKILDSIREVHKKEWDVSSLQSKEKHILSASEVTVILANVSRHLAFVRSSVSYVQKHLNTIKEPLEFVQDVTEAEGMEMYSKEAVDTVESLNEELNTVKTRISKIKCKVFNTSPDLITDEKPQGTQSSLRSGSLLVAGVAIVALGAFLFHKAQHST